MEIEQLSQHDFGKYKLELKQLFEENYYKNGGMLYSNDFLETSDRILIAKIENTIVAYMAIAYLKEEMLDRKYDVYEEEPVLENSILIKHLVVKTAYRKQGIATALFSFLKKECIQSGIPFVYIWTTPDNQSAIQLYQKQGFYKMADSFPEKYTFQGIENFHSIMLVCPILRKEKQ